MKKTKKIIILMLSLVILGLWIANKVYADPNSSKGFAEYDDEQAEQENQKMLEEQQKELKQTEGKSSNNYLESLKVEGYELFPEFDKQTIEYTLKGKAMSDEMNIVAIPSDAKATVQGAGKVKRSGNEVRIDVIAESGTVRTYTIRFSEEEKEAEPLQQEENEFEQPTEETSSVIQENGEIEKNQAGNSKTSLEHLDLWIMALAILLVIIIGGVIIKRKKTKGKHS